MEINAGCCGGLTLPFFLKAKTEQKVTIENDCNTELSFFLLLKRQLEKVRDKSKEGKMGIYKTVPMQGMTKQILWMNTCSWERSKTIHSLEYTLINQL